jgi:hypothetical protein
MLSALETYQGTPIVRAALRLAPLTLVRPGELRNRNHKSFALSRHGFSGIKKAAQPQTSTLPQSFDYSMNQAASADFSA